MSGFRTPSCASALAALVDELQGTPSFKPLVGGLGIYRATSAHGPFVHVDVRGWAASW